MYSFWFVSIFKLILRSNYRYDFCIQDLENFLFGEKDAISQFFVRIHVPDSWQSKNSKSCNCYNFWFRSISNLFFSATRNSISSIKISIENSELGDEYSIVKWSNFSFASESCENSEENLFFNFSQYSNSCFPRATGFIPTVRVGIEIFLFVEKFWMGEMSIRVPYIRILTVRNYQKVLFI